MADPLAQLYPGLVRGAHDATSQTVTDAELLTSVHTKAAESTSARDAFFRAHAEGLVRMARELADVFRAGGRLLTMGNGGSSCDAAHLAVEFNHPITVGRPSLPAIHLGADLPMVTAVGNDVGFRAIFLRTLISHGRAGDALFGFSTSGNSENLLAAFAGAKERGLVTFALNGGDGGRIAESAAVDHCLTVDSPSVHRVQEAHLTAYHILWDLVHTLLHDFRREEGSR